MITTESKLNLAGGMEQTVMTAVVADADWRAIETISYNLRKIGIGVVPVNTLSAAVTMSRVHEAGLVLLGNIATDMEKTAVCKVLRNSTQSPIVACFVAETAHGERAATLAGADLVCSPPVKIPALVRSIRALAWSKKGILCDTHFAPLAAGDLVVNPRQSEVCVRGRSVQVPPFDLEVLYFLAARAPAFVSSELLLSCIWNENKAKPNDSRVPVRILSIRRKIEDDPSSPKYLLYQAGLGYRLATSPASACAVAVGGQ